MALIYCPECGKQVSDTAPACIHCGYALAQRTYAAPQYTAPQLAPQYAPPQPAPQYAAPVAVKKEKGFPILPVATVGTALLFFLIRCMDFENFGLSELAQFMGFSAIIAGAVLGFIKGINAKVSSLVVSGGCFMLAFVKLVGLFNLSEAMSYGKFSSYLFLSMFGGFISIAAFVFTGVNYLLKNRMPFRIFKRIGLISSMGYSLMMLLVGVTRFGGGGYFYDYFLITLPLALGLMLYNMED